jgi:hydrogenase-4 component E
MSFLISTMLGPLVHLPWILHRLIRRLGVYWDTEPLLNISGTMLVGVLVVVFAFGLAQPISALAGTATRNSIDIAVAVILLSFVTMITRRKAMSQVSAFSRWRTALSSGS